MIACFRAFQTFCMYVHTCTNEHRTNKCVHTSSRFSLHASQYATYSAHLTTADPQENCFFFRAAYLHSRKLDLIVANTLIVPRTACNTPHTQCLHLYASSSLRFSSPPAELTAKSRLFRRTLLYAHALLIRATSARLSVCPQLQPRT